MILRTNRLKTHLKSGKTVFGTWSMLSSPTAVNAIGYANMDFVILDLEHGPSGYETLEQQLFAAEAAGYDPIVRVANSNEQNILHVLEVGAQSLLVSHVSSAEEARRVVSACKYAPEGDRGLSPFTRNHGYSDVELAPKLKKANDEMFVGVLVEGKKGLEQLEDICKIADLDMVYVGIYDISQTLGLAGNVSHPKVMQVVSDCVKVIATHGLVAGSVARDHDYIKFLFEAGFRFVSFRVDCAVLRDGFQTARNYFDDLVKSAEKTPSKGSKN